MLKTLGPSGVILRGQRGLLQGLRFAVCARFAVYSLRFGVLEVWKRWDLAREERLRG